MTDVYGFGNASSGQLGVEISDEAQPLIFSPILIHTLCNKNLRQIACGPRHSVATSEGGEIWTFGSNECGQLGHDKRQTIPQTIDMFQTFVVVSVACGEAFTCALVDTGKIFSWGRNDRGQLGHGDRENKSRPRQINLDTQKHFTQVACGSQFSVAVTNAGEVYCWGQNDQGQLGNGDVGKHKILLFSLLAHISH
eukprot:TRINITY_DN3050_c0_g1_i1.p1 TRINITY_DN3050_c0_g1~~TRINITY_DN3050_c0_g1_i1.p1  ORF type:complete len:195 (-),score=13.10 TRINITY_DN3050_c0_g1_i1:147-731(-)